MTKDEFISNVNQLISRVKSTKELPGVSETFAPGEKGAVKMYSSQETGEVEIEDKLMEELRKAASS